MENNLKITHPIFFRPLNLEKDASMLLTWVTNPRAEYWGMLDASIDDLKKAYNELLNIEDYEVFIGEINGVPAFLMESYDPKTDLIGNYYQAQEGDRGMHVLVKHSDERITGFTWHIFSSIMDFLFEHEKCQRVVVEPDVRNEKIHRLNKRAGFQYQKQLLLPHKTAFLAFCTLEDYQQSTGNLLLHSN